MEHLLNLLINYGYWGMFGAAFLAGSFIPYSSEAVLVALQATGLRPLQLVIYASAGNILGSIVNYQIGRMGRIDWIERYLHVKKEKIERAQHFLAGHGAWMGFFAFLPVIGTAVTIALGLMRANRLISYTSIAIGKFLRYAILAYGTSLVI
ncbi:MAG: DedA family protein [Prevotella sp.]|nr:DedA family protein [Prevotella sp.]